MKISIVIPNFNGAELLVKNLPAVSLAAMHYVDQVRNVVEIIIVDDSSTDSSASVISNFIHSANLGQTNLKFIQNDKNLGFSPTVNKGVRQAVGDIVILLNTDVIPKKDFLYPLLKHFDDEKVFAVGAMDTSIEQGKEVLRGRGIGKWQKGFLVHSAGKLDRNNSLWAGGGSSAFQKNIWEKLGGLDGLFAPFYWEDIDISYRALKSGYAVLFEKESVVVHEHEKGAIKTKYTKSDIQKIAYRNQYIFVWKNADAGMLISHVFWLPYHFIKAILRGDINFFIAFFKALQLFPQIYNARKKAQKHFIYSDYDIIEKYKQ